MAQLWMRSWRPSSHLGDVPWSDGEMLFNVKAHFEVADPSLPHPVDWAMELPNGTFDECVDAAKLLYAADFAADCFRVTLTLPGGWLREIWREGENWG